MSETKQPPDPRPDEVIAEIDRELELSQQLKRRHTDHVRSSRADDRQVLIDRRRQPR